MKLDFKVTDTTISVHHRSYRHFGVLPSQVGLVGPVIEMRPAMEM